MTVAAHMTKDGLVAHARDPITNWKIEILKKIKKSWILHVFLKVQKLNNIWEKNQKIEEKNKILFGNYQLKNIS